MRTEIMLIFLLTCKIDRIVTNIMSLPIDILLQRGLGRIFFTSIWLRFVTMYQQISKAKLRYITVRPTSERDLFLHLCAHLVSINVAAHICFSKNVLTWHIITCWRSMFTFIFSSFQDYFGEAYLCIFSTATPCLPGVVLYKHFQHFTVVRLIEIKLTQLKVWRTRMPFWQ